MRSLDVASVYVYYQAFRTDLEQKVDPAENNSSHESRDLLGDIKVTSDLPYIVRNKCLMLSRYTQTKHG